MPAIRKEVTYLLSAKEQDLLDKTLKSYRDGQTITLEDIARRVGCTVAEAEQGLMDGLAAGLISPKYFIHVEPDEH